MNTAKTVEAYHDKLLDWVLQTLKEEQNEWAFVLQVGDWIDGNDNKYYTFTGHQYETKGKMYQVREVDRRPGYTTAIVDGDYFDPKAHGKPERIWLSAGTKIVREGKVVWERQYKDYGDFKC